MAWYAYAAYFAGGVFLGNSIPHLVNGTSGRPFPTPFASPPGKGLSSALANVFWGLLNLVVAYFLLVRAGEFDIHNLADAGAFGAGIALMSIVSALGFGRLHGSSASQGVSS